MGRSVKSFENTVQASFSNAARSVAAFQGPLGPISGRLSSLASTVGTAGIALGAFALTVGGVGFSLKRAADEGEKFERSFLRIEALLKTTQNASGQTASGIRELSREIALATLASVEGVEAAAAKLLTFRSITGNTFERTLRLSQDLAEVGFGSIDSAATQLAKALEDPALGLTQLRRVGISFSQSQQDVIKDLAETGRLAEAQTLILDQLEQQVGGAGAGAAGGLSGAYDTLSQRVSEFWQALDTATGVGDTFADVASRIAEGLNQVNQALDPEEFKPLGIQVLEATDQLYKLEEQLNRLKDTPNALGITVVGNPQEVAQLEKEVQAQRDVVKALNDKLIAQGKATIAAREAGVETQKQIEAEQQKADADKKALELQKARQKEEDKRVATIKRVVEGLEGELTALTVQTTALQDANVTLDMAAQAYDIRNQQIRAGVDAMSEEGRKISELIKLRDQELSKIEDRKRIEDQITKDFDTAQKAAEDAAIDRQKELDDRSKELAKSGKEVGDTFVDAFRSFAEGADSASDAVKNLSYNLIEMIAQKNLFDPIATGIGGAIFGGGGGGLLSGLFGGFFADGGVPPMGKVSVVGENGPELFVPNTTGTIIPNDQIGSGGSGNTFYVDMKGASVEAVNELKVFVQKVNASIEPRAITAVANQRSRQPNLLGGA